MTVNESLGVQCILPIKAYLGRNSLLDPVLKSNLDYAMKAVEALPISKRSNAILDVAGDSTLLRISTGKPVFQHTVWNDGDGFKLLQKVTIKNTKLTARDIDESHFAGHQCRDEVLSCMKRAHEKVTSKEGGLSNVELKISCGELHLTYVTQSPSTTIEIQPKWRANIKSEHTRDVLRVMTLVEKSGEMSPHMLACFQHLIQCRSQSNPGSNVHILLMCDGQSVEFLCKEDEGDQQLGRMNTYMNAYNTGSKQSQRIVIYFGANNTPQMVTDYIYS